MGSKATETMRSLGRYHARRGLSPVLEDKEYLKAYDKEVGPFQPVTGQPSMNLRDPRRGWSTERPRDKYERPGRHVSGKYWLNWR